MATSNIQTAQFTIPAKVGSNEGIVRPALFGRFLYCIAASNYFKVRSNVGDEFPLYAGSHAGIDSDADTFEFINESTAPITCTVVFGTGDWGYNQFVAAVSFVPNTTYRYLNTVTVATTSTQLAASNPDRSELHLKCPTTNTDDVLLDSGWPLSPGETIILQDFSGAVSATNASGTGTVYVAEVAK